MSLQDLKQAVAELTPAERDELAYFLARLRRDIPPPTPGAVLIAHMDDFTFAPGAVDEMMMAIDAACG